MFSTLQENQRLILNITFRITKNLPKRYDIITFEAPSKSYDSKFNNDQSNPITLYENKPKELLKKFVYYNLEITKKVILKEL